MGFALSSCCDERSSGRTGRDHCRVRQCICSSFSGQTSGRRIPQIVKLKLQSCNAPPHPDLGNLLATGERSPFPSSRSLRLFDWRSICCDGDDDIEGAVEHDRERASPRIRTLTHSLSVCPASSVGATVGPGLSNPIPLRLR